MLPSAPYVLPPRFASALLPAHFSGVPVAAGAVGAPHIGPAFRFRWPFHTLVIGLTLHAKNGTLAELANLSVELQDGDDHRITTDGQGFELYVGGAQLVGGAPAAWGLQDVTGARLAGGRPFAFQRMVNAGEIWTMSFKNANLVPVTPELVFRLGVPRE